MDSIHTFEGHLGRVFSLAICCMPDGRRFVASASHDRTVKIWCLNTMELVRTIQYTDFVWRVFIVQIPQPCVVAFISAESKIQVSDLETGETLSVYSGRLIFAGNISIFKEPVIITAEGEEDVSFVDVVTGQNLKTIRGGFDKMFRAVVTGGSDPMLVFTTWNAQTRRSTIQTYSLLDSPSPPQSLPMSPTHSAGTGPFFAAGDEKDDEGCEFDWEELEETGEEYQYMAVEGEHNQAARRGSGSGRGAEPDSASAAGEGVGASADSGTDPGQRKWKAPGIASTATAMAVPGPVAGSPKGGSSGPLKRIASAISTGTSGSVCSSPRGGAGGTGGTGGGGCGSTCDSVVSNSCTSRMTLMFEGDSRDGVTSLVITLGGQHRICSGERRRRGCLGSNSTNCYLNNQLPTCWSTSCVFVVSLLSLFV
jgi:hypothetical protein